MLCFGMGAFVYDIYLLLVQTMKWFLKNRISNSCGWTLFQSSGVAVDPECVTTFNEMKLKHKHRYIIYALDKALKTIEVLKLGERGKPVRTINT